MLDSPAIVLPATIWAYWFCVGAMSVRVRRRARRLSGIVPNQPLEVAMWIVWLPLVAAWATLPWLAATRVATPWALPAFALATPYSLLRWTAVGLGLLCLLLSIRCWLRMGKNWRMSVTPGQRTELVTTGAFAHVRHPIYALSMLLMLCTALVVPTLPVLLMAAIHVSLMLMKAKNEERFLIGMHGSVDEDYRRRTGRFLPWPAQHSGG